MPTPRLVSDLDRVLSLADDVVRHKIVRPGSLIRFRHPICHGGVRPRKEHHVGNNVTLIGNLVEDPELRFTPSGVPMAKIRLAVNRRWRDNKRRLAGGHVFFGGTVWREQAETAAESLEKGSPGHRDRPSRAALLGDPGRREAVVVEIAIDEVGPSLRWATATVTKTARSGGGDFNAVPTPPSRPGRPQTTTARTRPRF
jgi:single-strand DNA-binding protein